ncbi:MAG: hypothetical protein HYY18_16540 [Planctomycetes bacterium]|nr:hypothetical protein [Planctomycetota bacterium]
MSRSLPLLLFLGTLASADSGAAGRRISELLERGPAVRHALLGVVREAKEVGDPNGAVPLVEALIAYADGRALEASEFAGRAARCADVDFGDRDWAIEADGELPVHPVRTRELLSLLQFLMDWGEEWEWRGRREAAKTAYESAAALSAKLGQRSTDLSEALALANFQYRAHHRLAGLALRSGDDAGFHAQAALANEAHVARTGLAATPAPSTREERRALIEIGPLALVRDCPEAPDHPVRALLEAPRVFAGKSPATVLVIALGDRFGDRALPLRWDAAMALLPHGKAAAPAIRRWAKTAADPSPGLALLARAGETTALDEDALGTAWGVRMCADENALERAFESLPRERRISVAFRLKDLRGEDEIDLGQ